MSRRGAQDAATLGRVAELIASGEDPNGYLVSAQTLRKVITDCAGASEAFKRRLLRFLEAFVICGSEHADAFRLGLAMGQFLSEIADSEFDQFQAIRTDIRNLDKLPFVSIKGRPVQ